MRTYEDKEEALLLPAAAKLDATDEALDATEEALDEAYAAAPTEPLNQYRPTRTSGRTHSKPTC